MGQIVQVRNGGLQPSLMIVGLGDAPHWNGGEAAFGADDRLVETIARLAEAGGAEALARLTLSSAGADEAGG